ncbi:MAG TPA: branched-chain amino acid ABC transporter permease [Pseudolysinimonas sp.]|jgi:branched-chain amino acid transport system permease protein
MAKAPHATSRTGRIGTGRVGNGRIGTGRVDTGRTGAVRAVLGLLAVVATAAALAFTALPAAATTLADPTGTPTPTPTATAPAQYAEIWVRVAADKSNVPGVTVKVTGPKSFSQSYVTGADGKVEVDVPRSGDYVFTLDATSLPDKALGPAINPLKITIAGGDQGDPAYFLLTPGGASTNPGSSASPSPGSGNGGGGVKTDYFALASNLIVNGIIFGLLLALASIGVSLIYGTTGLSNFAHGELVTFGALVGYVFSDVLHFPIPVALISAFVLGGVFGYAQDLGLWKPLRRRGVGLIPLMIVSIGLSLVLRYLYQFIFGPDQLVLPVPTGTTIAFGPVKLRQIDIVSVIICIVLLLLVAFLLLRTRIGKATRAVADNKSLAAASGINVERIIRIVWTGSGALAGLAGVLIGYHQTLRWDTGASILLLIFAAVTLGGFGTAFGALVGSLIIGLLVNLVPLFGSQYTTVQNAAALLVMIVILLIRPQGIFGRRERIG